MNLTALIKKGGLISAMTVTSATFATIKADSLVTVASVATVAVAKQPHPVPAMLPDQESLVRAWLASIEETDPAIIDEVVEECRNNLNARRYVLQCWGKLPTHPTPSRSIKCSTCLDFRTINHPHLGHCAAGQPEPVFGLWATDYRYCEQYRPRSINTNHSHQRPPTAKR